MGGTPVPDHRVLSEAILAKNVLTNIKGVSSCLAMFGRQMNLLLSFEPASATELGDDAEGAAGVSRHVARLRRAAVNGGAPATAADNISRRWQTKTRQAGELLELKDGDRIDFPGTRHLRLARPLRRHRPRRHI